MVVAKYSVAQSHSPVKFGVMDRFVVVFSWGTPTRTSTRGDPREFGNLTSDEYRSLKNHTKMKIFLTERWT
ncbi:hypothetical protein N665_0518s0015 [Sinapis alba]|nr:hypothetical protein N665_0518s0015 [Sinapis alba]